MAVDHVDLHVQEGELVALLGPSGSGKTTLLRLIAGLELPDSGQIFFHGVDTTHLPVKKKEVGFVFQHYALFRHLTVFENVAFGLKVRPRKYRPKPEVISQRVHELLHLVQLEGMASRHPYQLSGGQRQRVAMARALAVEPKVLLLDEPFGALDAKVRQELRRWLRRLHDEIHLTGLFVTHDQEEAMEVADRVVIMSKGKIEQIGTPEEVYNRPATAFVYNFLGQVNLFHGRMENGLFQIGDTTLELPATEGSDKTATVYLRPHHLDIDHQRYRNDQFGAKIRSINTAGSQVKIELISDWGDMVHVEMSHERFHALQLQKGLEVFVSPKKNENFVIDFQI